MPLVPALSMQQERVITSRGCLLGWCTVPPQGLRRSSRIPEDNDWSVFGESDRPSETTVVIRLTESCRNTILNILHLARNRFWKSLLVVCSADTSQLRGYYIKCACEVGTKWAWLQRDVLFRYDQCPYPRCCCRVLLLCMAWEGGCKGHGYRVLGCTETWTV